MGACIVKGKIKAVIIRQITNVYDMSTSHSGQLNKEFVFGLRITSSQTERLEAIDVSSPFYSLKHVQGEWYVVHMNTQGVIDGLGIRYLTGKNTKESLFHSSASGKSLRFSLQSNEYLQRMLVGFSESQATAIEFQTSGHSYSLGDVYECEYIADVDFTELDLAIVGFSAVFVEGVLGELAVYSAPVMEKTGGVKLVKVKQTDVSPAKVPELYIATKQHDSDLQNDRAEIKECFSHTRLLRRAVTGHRKETPVNIGSP